MKDIQQKSFPHDSIWPYRYFGEQLSFDEAYLNACEAAFEVLGEQDPHALRPFINVLLETQTNTGNQLLLCAYTHAGVGFAEEAMILLCRETSRLRAGYSDSPHWISRRLIEKYSPHCSAETFAALEVALAEYNTEYEQSDEGAEIRGRSSFTLLSALAPERRSAFVKERLAELTIKFKTPETPPMGARSYTVVSPISEEKAIEMNDEDWLKAIAEYSTPERQRTWSRPEIGGAEELAGMMYKLVVSEPERFANLALRFPQAAYPCFLMNVLYGLKEAIIAPALKINIARKVFDAQANAPITAAIDLLSRIKDTFLPADAIAFLARQATEHSDPDRELWRVEKKGEIAYFNGDILTCSINSVRGRAADAIGDLIFTDERYLNEFLPAIESLVRDPIISVRACVAKTLLAVAKYDTDKAFSLFDMLLETEDILLSTRFVDEFVRRGLAQHFPIMRPHIERMLRSEHDAVQRSGGRLACLARLYHKEADDLAVVALNGNTSSRLGAAEIAAHNLIYRDCREWCENALKVLFNDLDAAVRKESAKCFWNMRKKPDIPLSEYEQVIKCFLQSTAFAEAPSDLLHALKNSNQKLPAIVLDVCEIFIERCSPQARDIRTHHASDEHTVGPLVFRTYQQLAFDPSQLRALRLIDRMCEEGLHSAATNLLEFER